MSEMADDSNTADLNLIAAKEDVTYAERRLRDARAEMQDAEIAAMRARWVLYDLEKDVSNAE
jgi:hypothetical protein